MTTSTAFAPVISLAIRAEADAVWHALTDGAITPAYYYGFSAEFPATAGEQYRYTAGGADMITGTVLGIEPGRSIHMSFAGHWQPDVAALPESTVTIELAPPSMPLPGVTVLTLTHRGLPESPSARNLGHGWVMILSGLKSLLETGSPLAARAGH
ncbi:SRPBCC domain-containing protein [Microcella sp.]|uniref:SRPBCC domain-containing protein n=1 Tax=Microcella sp. TaxID=1913979 RepID=UPI00391B64C4